MNRADFILKSALEILVEGKIMTNTNWKEIEEKLNNGTYSNNDYLDLREETLSKMNRFLALFKEKVIQKYPDENNRPKELQSRIEKIDSILSKG